MKYELAIFPLSFLSDISLFLFVLLVVVTTSCFFSKKSRLTTFFTDSGVQVEKANNQLTISHLGSIGTTHKYRHYYFLAFAEMSARVAPFALRVVINQLQSDVLSTELILF